MRKKIKRSQKDKRRWGLAARLKHTRVGSNKKKK